MFRYGIKLKSTTAGAAALKLLRKHFPNVSLAELKSKIQAHDYIYLTDMEKYHQDGERRMAKLLRELDLFQPLQHRIREGLPVLGTCAGLILLASQLSNDSNTYFGTLPVIVRRNAYGRQLGSFHTEEEMKGIGKIPMTFIRAPYIEKAGDGVDVIATVDNNIVGVRYGNQIGLSFHPEVTEDIGVHRYFLDICQNDCGKRVTA